MATPLNLLIEESRVEIIKTINKTKLPAYLLEPIIKDIYLNISSIKKNEYDKAKKEYEQSLSEKTNIKK